MVELKMYGMNPEHEELGIKSEFVELTFFASKKWLSKINYFYIDQIEHDFYGIRVAFEDEIEPNMLLFKYSKTNLAILTEALSQ